MEGNLPERLISVRAVGGIQQKSRKRTDEKRRCTAVTGSPGHWDTQSHKGLAELGEKGEPTLSNKKKGEGDDG